MDINDHERIGIAVSGGKDSVATLLLMKPWWHKSTVYWSNPGAPLPETVELMRQVQAAVPHFVEVRSDVLTDIEHNGWPSDTVPHAMTRAGRFTMNTQGTLVRDRFECCTHNLMFPIHARMIEDGITLVVRGQRFDEELVNPVTVDGFVDSMGIQYHLPIADWTEDQVFDFLRLQAPEWIHPIYQHGGKSTLDCVCCTAYWGDRHQHYLDRFHPEAGANRREVIAQVRDATLIHLKEADD